LFFKLKFIYYLFIHYIIVSPSAALEVEIKLFLTIVLLLFYKGALMAGRGDDPGQRGPSGPPVSLCKHGSPGRSVSIQGSMCHICTT